MTAEPDESLGQKIPYESNFRNCQGDKACFWGKLGTKTQEQLIGRKLKRGIRQIVHYAAKAAGDLAGTATELLRDFITGRNVGIKLWTNLHNTLRKLGQSKTK